MNLSATNKVLGLTFKILDTKKQTTSVIQTSPEKVLLNPSKTVKPFERRMPEEVGVESSRLKEFLEKIL